MLDECARYFLAHKYSFEVSWVAIWLAFLAIYYDRRTPRP